ncbi:hypothetical protein EIN_283570 [Entamoeba invadens IP1]|uniref:Uncharacterized protein n=1 Tax=Entamoeba invadens IP1 TaxID=370355 RepID=L7FJL6_ENTIV|nr:hypothetical protein EIN_283570 [Entamoeba invadens IP1]ELP84811.1 hypothetical protein EIN_283570 [Entamoeba invadens IP1]|eukprot:XP_004184157.1 hypothetical protein EIN_283570 [Entamoeba invadens IP1]
MTCINQDQTKSIMNPPIPPQQGTTITIPFDEYVALRLADQKLEFMQRTNGDLKKEITVLQTEVTTFKKGLDEATFSYAQKMKQKEVFYEKQLEELRQKLDLKCREVENEKSLRIQSSIEGSMAKSKLTRLEQENQLLLEDCALVPQRKLPKAEPEPQHPRLGLPKVPSKPPISQEDIVKIQEMMISEKSLPKPVEHNPPIQEVLAPIKVDRSECYKMKPKKSRDDGVERKILRFCGAKELRSLKEKTEKEKRMSETHGKESGVKEEKNEYSTNERHVLRNKIDLRAEIKNLERNERYERSEKIDKGETSEKILTPRNKSEEKCEKKVTLLQ